MAFRKLPYKIQYRAFDFTLQRYISQSPSGRIINTVEYADPRWMVDVEVDCFEDVGLSEDLDFPTEIGRASCRERV